MRSRLLRFPKCLKSVLDSILPTRLLTDAARLETDNPPDAHETEARSCSACSTRAASRSPQP